MKADFETIKRHILLNDVVSVERAFATMDSRESMIVRLMENGLANELNGIVSRFLSIGMRRSTEKTISDFSHLNRTRR